MSFILDALKKSESEHGRMGGPTLYEMRVAPPRQRLPAWLIVLVVLLTVNLAALGWLALHRSGASPAAASPVAAASPALSATPAAAAVAATPQDAGSAAVRSAPAAQYPSEAPPPAQGYQAQGPDDGRTAAAPQTFAGTGAVAGGARSTGEPEPASEAGRPDDDAPAVEPAPAAAPGHAPGPVVTASGAPAAATLPTASGAPTLGALPTYQQLVASGPRLPDLKLDLHAYAASAAQRFVMINMTRLQEGDSLPSGVRVDAITPDGAILTYQGQQFLLPRP